MVSCSAICSQLLAMLGLDSAPHLLYAYLFMYIMTLYLKAASEQQSLILYFDNPVILPWCCSTSCWWIAIWWSTTHLIHLTSCHANSFLLLKVKTTVRGRWFCVHPWSCKEVSRAHVNIWIAKIMNDVTTSCAYWKTECQLSDCDIFISMNDSITI